MYSPRACLFCADLRTEVYKEGRKLKPPRLLEEGETYKMLVYPLLYSEYAVMLCTLALVSFRFLKL